MHRYQINALERSRAQICFTWNHCILAKIQVSWNGGWPPCDMHHRAWLGFFCAASHLSGRAAVLDDPLLFGLDTLHFPVSKPWPCCQTAAISHPVARPEDCHLRCWKKNSFSALAGKLQGPEARELGVRDQNCGPNIATHSQALVQFVWISFRPEFHFRTNL